MARPLHLWLAALLGLAPLVVLRGSYDPSELPKSAVIQVGALALLALAVARGEPLVRHRLGPPLLALIGWSWLSLLWAENRYEHFLRASHWTACAVLAWLLPSLVRGAGALRAILLAAFAAGVAVSLVGVAQRLLGLAWIPQAFPPAATFANKNVAAQFVVVALPLGLALLSPPNRRALALAAVGGGTAALYLAFAASRAAWLALAAEAVVLALALRGPLRGLARPLLGAAAGGALGLVLVLWLTPPGLGARLARAREHVLAPLGSGDSASAVSVRARLAIWANTLAMIRDRPLLGFGLGNHRVHYPLYARAAAEDPLFRPSLQLDWVHNDYLQLAAELGIVGVALAAWLAAAAWGAARAAYTAAAQAPEVVAAQGAALAGLLTVAFFDFPMQAAVPPLMLGVLLGGVAALDPSARPLSVPARPRHAALAAAVLILLGVAAVQARWVAADRHCLRALRADARRDWRAVAREAEAARSLNPWRHEPHFLLGKALMLLGRPAEALGPLREASRAYPRDMATLGNLAGATAATGDLETALGLYRRILELEPRDAQTHYAMGFALEKGGRVGEALAAYRLASRHAPGSAWFAYKHGVAALASGAAEEAADALRRAVALDPRLAPAHKGLGVVLTEALGRREEGLAHLRRALELDPRIEDAERIRQILERADR